MEDLEGRGRLFFLPVDSTQCSPHVWYTAIKFAIAIFVGADSGAPFVCKGT